MCSRKASDLEIQAILEFVGQLPRLMDAEEREALSKLAACV
jgi:hypothetical protein